VNKRAACPQCRMRVRIVAADPAPEESKPKGCFLVKAGGDTQDELIFLGGDRPIDVGKADNAHLRLLASSVSRRHCRLVQIERGWRIEDAGSTNGLYVNSHRVKGHNLLHGDVVRIGDFELRYSYEVTKQTDAESASDLSTASDASTSHVAISELAAIPALSFLDDTAALEATAAATTTGKSKAGGRSPVAVVNGEGEPDLFEFAADVDAGPPISLPMEAPSTVDKQCPNCGLPSAPGARICVPCGIDLVTGKLLRTDTGMPAAPTDTGGKLAEFFRGSMASFGFIANPGSLVTFLILAAIACMQPIINMAPGCMSLLATVVVQGWIASYLFNVVLDAANGEEDLPDLALTGGWMDDVIVPFFKFMVTWLAALTPAIAYIAWIATSGPQLLTNPTAEIVALAAAGVLLWPIIVLAVAVGGVATVLRVDLLVKTVVRTFVPYLLVCVLAGVAFGSSWFTQGVLPRMSGLGGSALATSMVSIVVGLYFWIVAMRCIGLYYHHFKGRFAWSWG
jgi:hypothetical protein